MQEHSSNRAVNAVSQASIICSKLLDCASVHHSVMALEENCYDLHAMTLSRVQLFQRMSSQFRYSS